MRTVLAAILILAAGLTRAAAPVTQKEGDATLAEVEKALSALPGLKHIKPQTRKPSSTKPATRAYIILQMNRIFERAKPSFKFTPRKVRFDPKVLVAGAERSALEKLIAWGCVAKVGPLATGPKSTIGLKEFGDAMGFFVARISDLSHTPDPKYSPGMMGGG